MTVASKPIRYELTIKNGTIYSLIYRAEGKPIVIEACQLNNGISLPKSRQWLTKMAERWGVPPWRHYAAAARAWSPAPRPPAGRRPEPPGSYRRPLPARLREKALPK